MPLICFGDSEIRNKEGRSISKPSIVPVGLEYYGTDNGKHSAEKNDNCVDTTALQVGHPFPMNASSSTEDAVTLNTVHQRNSGNPQNGGKSREK
jgi:hypothetical protein